MPSTANGTISVRIPDFEYKPSANRPAGAPWIRTVERRIAESSRPDPNSPERARGLPQSTAMAALRFFKATSDLLPNEPYIYGSPLGDLVAEFTVERGTLTSIIGPSFALLYAIVGGMPIETRVSTERSEDELRSQVKQLMESLLTGKHGALGTGR
jgi:hypothetical protein